ncbi:MAG: hypothetical protein FD175_1054 [Beijerinckiaceae bacterium]|nr:MAG: hypothetical protein FD175_1054 [Beijerinckiaceae bacterium]
MISRAPEVVFLAVDLHEDLVKMPPPMAESPHRLNAVSPDLSSQNGSEPVPPEPHRLVGDIDTPLVKQILDIPQRQRIAVTLSAMLPGTSSGNLRDAHMHDGAAFSPRSRERDAVAPAGFRSIERDIRFLQHQIERHAKRALGNPDTR